MGCLQSTEATPTIGHSLAATNPARSLQPAFVFIDQEESAVGTEQLPPLSVVVPQELSSRPAENPLHLPDSPASSSQQIFPAVAFACSMALDGQQSTSSGSQHGLHDQAFVTAGADAPSFGAISSTAARRHRRSRRTSDEPSWHHLLGMERRRQSKPCHQRTPIARRPVGIVRRRGALLSSLHSQNEVRTRSCPLTV